MTTSGDITPGLVCAHHHLYSALARGMPSPPSTPTTFLGVLEQVWWRLDTALDLEMLAWSAKLGALEALEAGCTAIIDHHESPNAIEGSLSVIADACAEVGVRVVVAYGVTDRHGSDGARRGLAENDRFLREGGRGMVGVHAAFTCTDDTLAAAAELAVRHGVGVHIHVAEGPDDVGAAERLAELSADDWLLIHGVHLADDHGLHGTIVHNPRSNMNNAVGYARPVRFASPVALGTDGIGADMLAEFQLAFVAAPPTSRSAPTPPGAGSSTAGRSFPRRGPIGSGGRTRRWNRGISPTRRRFGRSTSTSTANRHCVTGCPPGSTPSRSGPGPQSRPPVSTPASDVHVVPGTLRTYTMCLAQRVRQVTTTVVPTSANAQRNAASRSC
jgi:hypothetical protein